MALNKNEIITKVNRNFRYSLMYIVISVCIWIYYIGIVAWMLSQNNNNVEKIYGFCEENKLAWALMLVGSIMTIVSAVIFVLHFILTFRNSIQILSCGNIAPKSVKVWTGFTFLFLVLTLVELALSITSNYVRIEFVNPYINYFNIIFPLGLLITTGASKICMKAAK